MASGIAQHHLIDGFLDPRLHGELLAYALANRDAFVPTHVVKQGRKLVNPRGRRSLKCSLGLGPLKNRMRAAANEVFTEGCAATGLAPFPLARIETELTGHGDGHFYHLHHDTITQANRATDRVLSGVYYFHRLPQGFSGGELALHPFRDGEPLLIQPLDNRLILFPSIAPHAVCEVRCPSGNFADYRFAVNCWFHRARQ